jgi:hypothetical protein
MVATSSDYRECYRRLQTGLLGSYLKLLLGTKTTLYTGYSVRDADFLKIHGILRQFARGTMPRSYALTLDPDAPKRLAQIGIKGIVTDATYFLERIKEHLVEEGLVIPSARFSALKDIQQRLLVAHQATSSISIRNHPFAILSGHYQDGFLHAIERILRRQNSGQYSNPAAISDLIKNYRFMRSERLKYGKYGDVSYIDGYIAGLTLLLLGPLDYRHAPLYYVFGAKHNPTSVSELRAVLRVRENLHSRALRWCESLVRELNPAPGVVFHHGPTLL